MVESSTYCGRSLLRYISGQAIHTHASVAERYNDDVRWDAADCKVTAGLAENNNSLPPGQWVISPDLYYFSSRYCTALESYVHHVAADKLVNLPTKWRQVLLHGVDGRSVVVST